MPHETRGRGATWGGVRRWWRAVLGEALGTALLAALGLASLLPPSEVRLTHPALAFGFVVTALIQVFGPVSGAHLNPAVTLAALLSGQVPWGAALAYAAAQCAGAVAGFGLLEAALPLRGCAAATAPGAGVSAGGALLLEALMTGCLALACAAAWRAHDAARPDHAAPLKLGATVAGLVYAGGKLTGASLNPARSLAPALWRGCWRAHWLYWAGPLAGAALAALLHRHLLLPLPPAPAAAPTPTAPHEDLPLHDKRDR